ncbi:protein of unknown function UPF0153 [Deinococcus proteolyticus MRP]|uniref:YkgJ family cysteine cluster protein n=1 Tax=Deinococcus proteolyticus (strain ATCC 35074 / DSM 20540 / JCM 6276 / NBRC 101906 / NCIMB 13154 / VKM Ac-1939 / CCM 2703 / MRP) TaxID=693977 RepID=F0RL43_DEIPM|nr:MULTISPECIES: YkgJ family cysteine cluster protein [Deinococcus]ADY26835.1 protein of unknown function UPF0153 [Deinococcus proteolyticus MRP]MCY1702957.1 YkgJ family cysteine cluster protein [Deinococcus sp. SL84]
MTFPPPSAAGEAVPPGYPPRSAWPREGRSCTACGACCTAPDIAALGKPLGQPCQHLGAGCLCAIYATRPSICRSYQPDWVCGEVAPLPTLAARATRFLEIYGLLEEARRVEAETRTAVSP